MVIEIYLPAIGSHFFQCASFLTALLDNARGLPSKTPTAEWLQLFPRFLHSYKFIPWLVKGVGQFAGLFQSWKRKRTLLTAYQNNALLHIFLSVYRLARTRAGIITSTTFHNKLYTPIIHRLCWNRNDRSSIVIRHFIRRAKWFARIVDLNPLGFIPSKIAYANTSLRKMRDIFDYYSVFFDD